MRQCPTCGKTTTGTKNTFCPKCGDIFVNYKNKQSDKDQSGSQSKNKTPIDKRIIYRLFSLFLFFPLFLFSIFVLFAIVELFKSNLSPTNEGNDIIENEIKTIQEQYNNSYEIDFSTYNIEEDFMNLYEQSQDYLALTIESEDIIETYESRYYDIFRKLHSVDSRYHNTKIREPSFSQDEVMELKGLITVKKHSFDEQVGLIAKIYNEKTFNEYLPTFAKKIKDYLALTVDSPEIKDAYDTDFKYLYDKLEYLEKYMKNTSYSNALQAKLQIKHMHLEDEVEKIERQIDWVVGDIVEIQGSMYGLSVEETMSYGVQYEIYYENEYIYLKSSSDIPYYSRPIIRAEIVEPIGDVYVLNVLAIKRRASDDFIEIEK